MNANRCASHLGGRFRSCGYHPSKPFFTTECIGPNRMSLKVDVDLRGMSSAFIED
jgi:hypothetical protein